MRDLVLAKLAKIREREHNFPKGTMRWQHIKHEGVHLSALDFSKLGDEELLSVLEVVIQRSFMQM